MEFVQETGLVPEMELIQDQPFANETIALDGFAFRRCAFEDCFIMIRSEGYHFEQCTFRNVRILISPEVSISALTRRLASCRCENIVCLWNPVPEGEARRLKRHARCGYDPGMNHFGRPGERHEENRSCRSRHFQ